MMKRRKFITIAGMGVVALGGATYIVHNNYQNKKYEQRVADIWSHSQSFSSDQAVMIELVRYATLAANSHNTQPWLFKIEDQRIYIHPDFSRRCPVVDPDNHHLYASLGCATENIVYAAKAFGLKANVSVGNDSSDDVIQIDFEPMPAKKSELFLAIPKRQCTKVTYDGKQVPVQQLKKLEISAEDKGISTQLFTDKNDLETLLEYVVEGNTVQMRDEAFMKELKAWIRFNPSSAVKYGDGLYSASTGNPTPPSWLGNLIFNMAFTDQAENDKYTDQIRSSAGIIAFISEQNDIKHWIKAGRSYQRFALQATALGIKHAFINQPVEVPEVRTQLAEYLNIGEQRTDLLIRFGYGPEMPRSLRRPVDQVIVQTDS